ncbi:MAG: hypothetical protein KIT81_13040 [Alphaproteobacteria bacterium]|nr:hypothetical protein [Alphaproteobacteria bacterium]
MMRPCPYPPADLLPHAGAMVLIEESVGYDETGFIAALTVRESSLFRVGTGVPAYIGIEYMAQTCGAFAGMTARRAGQPVQMGFLLGTRNFSADRECFRIGERLEVGARLLLDEGEMSAFACAISIAGREVARAQLNLFRPRDPSSFLAGAGA